MTPLEILLLLAIAALVYQEIAWRDKARRIETDYEKRLSTEVAMAYEASLADEETPLRRAHFSGREAGAARIVSRGDAAPVYRHHHGGRQREVCSRRFERDGPV